MLEPLNDLSYADLLALRDRMAWSPQVLREILEEILRRGEPLDLAVLDDLVDAIHVAELTRIEAEMAAIKRRFRPDTPAPRPALDLFDADQVTRRPPAEGFDGASEPVDSDRVTRPPEATAGPGGETKPPSAPLFAPPADEPQRVPVRWVERKLGLGLGELEALLGYGLSNGDEEPRKLAKSELRYVCFRLLSFADQLSETIREGAYDVLDRVHWDTEAIPAEVAADGLRGALQQQRDAALGDTSNGGRPAPDVDESAAGPLEARISALEGALEALRA